MNGSTDTESAQELVGLPLAGMVIDLARQELRDIKGQHIDLRPQAFQVLKLLVENAGEVVPKATILKAIWGHSVVTDDSLVQAVKDLRKALGDTDHTMIKTIPRRGYQLISGAVAPFVAESPDPVAPAAALASGAASAEGGSPPNRTVSRLPTSTLLLLILLGIILATYFGLDASDPSLSPPKSSASTVPEQMDAPAAEVESKPSIAVLPFQNMSEDPAQEYFASGITDDLTTDLSRVSGLFVVGRRAARSISAEQQDLRQVASDLGVRYVLEGSVRRVGQQLRINAQLIDGANGRLIWADRFDGTMADVFSLQDRVNQRIVGALKISLSPV